MTPEIAALAEGRVTIRDITDIESLCQRSVS